MKNKMETEKLDKAIFIKREIGYCEEEIRRFKRVRQQITDNKDERRVIEDVWHDFHLFSYQNEWAVELRGKIIKLMLQTVDERLEQLGKDMIALEKQFDDV